MIRLSWFLVSWCQKDMYLKEKCLTTLALQRLDDPLTSITRRSMKIVVMITAARELRESLDVHVGFLSLSKTWKSLPMWAHYADAFTGAVIEFDGNHEFFEWAFEIEYSRHRPIRDVTLYLNERIPIVEVCDKSIEWRFEEEVRVARNLLDCQQEGMSGDYPIYVMQHVPRE